MLFQNNKGEFNVSRMVHHTEENVWFTVKEQIRDTGLWNKKLQKVNWPGVTILGNFG
jgi:hypothetical protein